MELPRVLHQEMSDDHARLELEIPAGLCWFEGHFPGHPILPGVVQLGWVMHFAVMVFSLGSAAVGSLEQIKFKRPIGPELRVTLLLKLRRELGAVDYELRDTSTSFASGTVKFSGVA